MNEYVVIALDGLLYVLGTLILALLSLLVARLWRRRAATAGIWTALCSVVLVVLIQQKLPDQLRAFFPTLDPMLGQAICLALGFCAAIAMAYWWFRLTAPQAAVTGAFIALGVLGFSRLVPMVSEKLLPEGPRLKDAIADAEERTRQAREAAKQFKTVNEVAPSVIAVALDSMSTLASKQEFDSIKSQFKEGTKFLAERKALMDAMPPQEREEYRKAMAEFLAEQGIAQDRYSLAALKNAKIEDVHNLVAFMREMNSTEAPKPATDVPVRPPAESLQIILRNVQGMTFEKTDHEAMATLSNMLFKEGAVPAIAQARKELQGGKVNPAWVGPFLAAALETASGVPAEMALESSDALAAEEAAKKPAGPVPVTYLNLSTHYGFLRMPSGTRGLRAMTDAANQIPVTGILAAGANPDRSRAALGRNSVPIGGFYMVRQGDVTYRFRFDRIQNGQIYVVCDRVQMPKGRTE